MRTRLASLLASVTTPASFAVFQRGESARWGKMIREAGIKVE